MSEIEEVQDQSISVTARDVVINEATPRDDIAVTARDVIINRKRPQLFGVPIPQGPSFAIGVYLSIFTLILVAGITVPSYVSSSNNNDTQTSLPEEARQVGAFIAGMFGFAAVEAFRKSSAENRE